MGRSYKLSTGETLFITLMRDVKNSADLKRQVISQELQCGFVSPSFILDPFQIAVASDKAALARSRNKLITKNIYSEILFNLSPSKHISKSLNKFGSQEKDKNIIVIVIGTEDELNTVISQVCFFITSVTQN